MSLTNNDVYSIIIAVHPDNERADDRGQDWRLGEITVDWVDFTREKSTDKREKEGDEYYNAPRSPTQHRKHHDLGPVNQLNSNGDDSNMHVVPGSATHAQAHHGATPSEDRATPQSSRSKPKPKKKKPEDTPDALSLQPLLAHIPGPNPVTVDTSSASGVTHVGRGVVHLFRHAPPASLVARLEGQNGESSRARAGAAAETWAGEHAEGEDGSLLAILAVPAWMRPADLLEFLGGWVTGLEGVRMIREATTPNRSIVLLKFRDPLQANDFMVIFTGRAFSTLDARETCHAIRIHHLVLHKLEDGKHGDVAVPVPAFPPSVYASRARQLPDLLKGVPPRRYELPSCPVCLERLDSTITGLVTLPCAHTFDCDCLRKWGDSRCPVCRVSHLLLSTAQGVQSPDHRDEVTRLTRCGMCDSSENNWICVVCGVVGCGRYSKGHARAHWKESGHLLAMELETQRVWDYKGDNYVHRLIQTRTDGKLVELPSASSLATPTPSRTLPLNRPLEDRPTSHRPSPTPGSHQRTDSGTGFGAGPSSNDMEKMSTIEAITLEYSYLLSSQLEAMRQHYEEEAAAQRAHVEVLEASNARVREAESDAAAAEVQRQEAERAREKAEARATKALELSRGLQASLGSEKAMTEGLNARVAKLRQDLETVRAARDEKTAEVAGLEETVRDLMFTLEAGLKIQQEGGGADGGEGGDLVVVGGSKKKGKKK